MSRSRLKLGLVVGSFLLCAVGLAPTSVWRVLGEANVLIASDHVTIPVHSSRREVRTVKLQLRQTIVPLRIETLRLHFRDGRGQEVNLSEVIAGGAESRAIDLEGRGLESVEIGYESKVVRSASKRIARLRLVGRE